MQKEHGADTLRERNKELREQLKTKDTFILDSCKTKECLKNQIKALENEVDDLKLNLQNKEKFNEIEKAKCNERLKVLNDTCEDTKNVERKYAETQDQYDEIIRQNNNLSKECEEKTKEVIQLREELETLKIEMTKIQSECSRYEKLTSTLKTACIDMENDLNDFETLVDARDLKVEKFVNERNEFQGEIAKCKKELENLKSSLQDKEKHREEILKHVCELNGELENQSFLHETEVQMLQDQLNQYEKSLSEIKKLRSDLRSDASSYYTDSANYSEKILDLESQLYVIKEKATGHITQISSLKASNLKLTQSLDEAIRKQRKSEKIVNELYNEKESEKAEYDYEKIKLQETISQQTKLIDFLQTKTKSMGKKKNPIARIFGKKYTSQPSVQTRDSEKLLKTERSRCRRLQDQLSQARAEKNGLTKTNK